MEVLGKAAEVVLSTSAVTPGEPVFGLRVRFTLSIDSVLINERDVLPLAHSLPASGVLRHNLW